MTNWLLHPVTAFFNWHDDRQVALLLTALLLHRPSEVEHEQLRAALGWSAAHFDRIADLAVDLGYIEYTLTAPVSGLPKYGQVTKYFFTTKGLTAIKRARGAS